MRYISSLPHFNFLLQLLHKHSEFETCPFVTWFLHLFPLSGKISVPHVFLCFPIKHPTEGCIVTSCVFVVFFNYYPLVNHYYWSFWWLSSVECEWVFKVMQNIFLHPWLGRQGLHIKYKLTMQRNICCMMFGNLLVIWNKVIFLEFTSP